MSKINGDDPAYPVEAKDWRDIPNHPAPGQSIRLDIAKHALPSVILRSPESYLEPDLMAARAVRMADALIAALNQPTEETK